MIGLKANKSTGSLAIMAKITHKATKNGSKDDKIQKKQIYS